MTNCTDIIKGLECCNNDIICNDCPYCDHHDCLYDLKEDACDLIKRQQAEIERLKEMVGDIK